MNTHPVLFLPYLLGSLLVFVMLFKKRSGPQSASGQIAMASVTLTAGYFFYTIISFSTPAAFIDDYSLLESFHRMLYSETSSDKLKALFEQVNEHRFPFERILMYFIHLIFGNPSPQIQVIIGNLFLLGILWLFYQFFRETNQPAAYFIPVALILFSLVFYQNAYWGIAAIQNTPLIFFAALSSYGLSKSSAKGNITGITAGLAATFTSGSGIAVWILGSIIIIMQGRGRLLATWLGFAGLALAFYFGFDYTFIAKDRSGLFQYAFNNLSLFFCFLGGIFYGGFDYVGIFRPGVIASVGAGIALFGISVWWFISFAMNRKNKRQWVYGFLTGVILFVLGTAAMLVISRPVKSDILNMDEFITSRYLIFSAVLWASGYLALLFLKRTSKAASEKIFYLFLVLNTIINFASYYSHIPRLADHQATLNLDKLYTSQHDGMLLSSGDNFEDRMFWNHPTRFKSLIKKLEESGLYNPEQKPDTDVIRQARLPGSEKADPEFRISLASQDALGFNGRPNPFIRITATPAECPDGHPDYFLLQSSNHQFLLPAVPERASNTEILFKLRFWTCRYSFTFRKNKFPAGEYDIYLIAGQKAANAQIIKTDRKLTLKDDAAASL